MSEQHKENQESGQRPEQAMGRKKRSGKRRRGALSVVKGIFAVLGTLLLIGITTGAILCCFAAVYIRTAILPHANIKINDFFVGENSVMYYMDAETGDYQPLVTLLNTTSSIWVDYEDLPQALLDATVAIEDKRFYEHNGVDWIRTAKGVLSMATGQRIEGGSTITQQLIKNLTEYDDVTVKRKITEIFRALTLEASGSFTKQDILTWYLNIIFMGERCKGVGSASYEYFGKPVGELSLAQCASLIAITNNPSIYSPYGTLVVRDPDTGEEKTSRDYNKQRQELILWLMLEQEKITQAQYDAAMAEPLEFVRTPGEEDTSTIYSWYEEQVIKDVRNDLMAQYGYSAEAANMLLSSGGLSIFTCLDPEIQAMAEAVYADRANLNYTSPSGDQKLQSAITVLDNQTGNVVAIVGRVGPKESNLLRNFATDTHRQPGSSIKPLSVYAPALEMGLITPYTVLDDYPYQELGRKPWPVNVDGRYRGLVTVKEAVTHSYNTVAVRTLIDYVTPLRGFQFMEDQFHIDLVDAVDVGGNIMSDIDASPLALGGLTNGVNTRDMATAYAVFPNGGVYRPSRTYTQVVNSQGEVLLTNEPEAEVVLKETTAYYINDMLKSVVSGGSGTAAQLRGMTVAGKTGTTDSKFDRWFVGYTPYYTAAVWIGYEYNERVTAPGNPAVNMWQKVMSQVHQGLDNKDFSASGNLVSFSYCVDSGLLPTDYCRSDPRGSRVASNGRAVQGQAPTEFCPYHTAESTVSVCVDSPILDANGAGIGLYHLAGEFCPEESRREISLLYYDRLSVGSAVTEDWKYSYFYTEAAGTCQIHTTAPEPELPDPWEPWNPWNPWDPWNPGGGTEPEDPDQPPPEDEEDPNLPINPETGLPPGY